ncbi:MAG: 2,3-bisphosphoglycerate-independent phosphoglycerate mutase [Burkholderiales bacterium]|nr:2,3-bisphosphoglycerate-independent phosphoglycerate mutase [Burkholderiales bacterium]
MHPTPVLLIILDGFGHRDNGADNAIHRARKPNWDRYWRTYAHTTINASELHVGLPPEQMGNSEVGHLNIGAGRVVFQEFTRIELAIRNGELAANAVLAGAVATARERGSSLHILGLLSPGGVHSHEDQIFAMLDMAAARGLKRICVHAFLDGRDTPPKSAADSLHKLEARCAEHPGARIASICGRYYAMDRDKRWDRTAAAYQLLTEGKALHEAPGALAALDAAYARGESDEFVKPTAIRAGGAPAATIGDGDAVVFMNFRADRARQLTHALTDPRFQAFARAVRPDLAYYCTLTSYGEEFDLPVAFAPQRVERGFGQYMAELGLRQLRIAETEKYAHVTYFFNGGIETPYAGEERILVPSPKVATYDLKPEMSAVEVTDKLVEAIRSRRFHAIICNYANADMVGHTGNLEAATRAIETLDQCLGRAIEAMRESGGEALVSADHGNAEMMLDPQTRQAHTAHTTNRVPLLYVGRPAQLAGSGALSDIAPTLLAMMGLPQPAEMTGKALVTFT